MDFGDRLSTLRRLMLFIQATVPCGPNTRNALLPFRLNTFRRFEGLLLVVLWVWRVISHLSAKLVGSSFCLNRVRRRVTWKKKRRTTVSLCPLLHGENQAISEHVSVFGSHKLITWELFLSANCHMSLEFCLSLKKKEKDVFGQAQHLVWKNNSRWKKRKWKKRHTLTYTISISMHFFLSKM